MRAMMRAVRQALLIVALAGVASLASYLLRPDVLPWNVAEGEIELSGVAALGEVLWVDARTEEDFLRRHLPGALLLNEDAWEDGFGPLLERWTPEMAIVVYCSSQSCLRSHHVAERLRSELGAERVFALQGGWEAIEASGMTGGEVL